MEMGKEPKRLQFNRNTFSPTKREIKKKLSKTLLTKQKKNYKYVCTLNSKIQCLSHEGRREVVPSAYGGM
jgi:hypothetical protein